MINKENKKSTETNRVNKDYRDQNNVLHCGVCHEPKEMYHPKAQELFKKPCLPLKCACERQEHERMQERGKEFEHERTVYSLREKCFRKKNMYHWNFENDNGLNSKMKIAKEYVECWNEENGGLLLWGSVGMGKTYMAACIANALLEKEVSVHMTNFAIILNDLSGYNCDKNEYIDKLCAFDLLIIDDFGMERTTNYGTEQIFNVIDNISCSNARLIVTTNLTLNEIRNTTDLTYKRIFDRILAKCKPVLINDVNQREKVIESTKK